MQQLKKEINYYIVKSNTKLAKIRIAMEDENWDAALKIAASFSRLDKHKEVIKRAAESLVNPSFYQQMGYDLDQLKNEGIAALKDLYSKSWKEVKPNKN